MCIRDRLYPRLKAAAERGCPMVGVCNGFQVLVQAGILPGPAAGARWPETAPKPTGALTDHASDRIIEDREGVEDVQASLIHS